MLQVLIDTFFYAVSRLHENRSNAVSHIILYLLLDQFGDEDEDVLINYLRHVVSVTEKECEKFADAIQKHDWHDEKYEKKRVYFSDTIQKLIKEIRNIDDITSIMRTVEKKHGANTDSAPNKKIEQLLNDFFSREEREGDVLTSHDIDATVSFVYGSSRFINENLLSITKLFGDISVTKEEQKEILARISAFNTVSDGSTTYITLLTYVASLMMFIMTKHIINSKEFFFENNNETMYSVVSLLKENLQEKENELQASIKSISTKENEIETLESQLKVVSDNLSRSEKDLLKPYKDEIVALKKSVEELECKLNAEKNINEELILLRNFAFDTQSEYNVQECSGLGEKYLKEHKIIVIGGHINWRNNLKKKYPNIIIYDGHVETVDLSPLKSAEFVFLKVSNMSHGMYYKVMNVLRECNTPFDYLGRTINQELHEQEMADILHSLSPYLSTQKTDVLSESIRRGNEFWKSALGNEASYNKFRKLQYVNQAYDALRSYISGSPKKIQLILCDFVFDNYMSYVPKDVREQLKLCYLAEVYGSLSEEKKYFFIDEFQNYSQDEIELLKCVYPNAIFNLFGDFDQRLDDKGVNGTDDVSEILDTDFYSINENYRNALEITKYINVNLGKNMLPIGLHGAVYEQNGRYNFEMKGRTAIIVSESRRDFKEKLIRNHRDKVNNVASSQEIMKDKFNVLSVSEAKGLEFETVYVLVSGMSANEKYIAYTRALSNLILLK